ncbi:MAG: (2Fe-2S)-binding protein [Phycisphaerae bacterium]|nr:(2Fe-2S)-binding protein [Phycisphaerae bacterium]
MIKLRIDNKSIEVAENTTILQAANSIGIDIPTLCYLQGKKPCTSCFVCVVKVQGIDNFVPACATVAKDGMVVDTQSDDVLKARKGALELLLSDHLGDCYEPCKIACPFGLDISAMLTHIENKNDDKAIKVMKNAMPMPAIVSLLCPRPCESICRRKQFDTSIPIASIKIQLAQNDLAKEKPYTPAPAQNIGKNIAIIGAGPAGLTAAYLMTIAGCNCTVFDKNNKPGGTLNDTKIDKELLTAETMEILEACHEVHLSQELGVDFTLEQLSKDYNAVILATGENKIEQANLQYSKTGIAIDTQTHKTSIDKVYSIGSAVKPAKSAVLAMGKVKKSCSDIISHLKGDKIDNPKLFNCRIGKLNEQHIEAIKAIMPARPNNEKDNILESAKLCLHCDCLKKEQCGLKKYSQQYDANFQSFQCDKPALEKIECEIDGRHVIYESGKCIKCGKCITINPNLTFINRGYNSTLSPAIGMDWPEALSVKTDEIINNCPTAALSFQD